MVLAKPAGQKPRDLAAALAARLEQIPEVTAVEVAGPGFINLRLAPAVWHARLGDILRAGTAYGDGDLGQEQGQGQAVNVEYVSAHPTRTDERRVGTACTSKCRTRGWPSHKKNKKQKTN